VECENSVVSIKSHTTGETFKIGCKRWDCPVCGPKKKYRLSSYFASQLRGYEVVRLLTVTLRSFSHIPPQSHYGLLQEVWRRTLTDLRRDSSVVGSRKVRYLRVNEQHKSGYAHLHLLIDTFIPQKWLYSRLNHHARIVMNLPDYTDQLASANIELIQDNRHFGRGSEAQIRNIERYLLKNLKEYVLKDVRHSGRPYRKVWSRSSGFANVPKGKPIEDKLIITIDGRRRFSSLNLFFKAYLRNTSIDLLSKEELFIKLLYNVW
jgi:hypothetical protein